jgi:uncharacterized membrane protein
MRWVRNNWGYILLALIVAFAVHVASVALIPRLVMTVALNKMSAAHGFNTMLYTPRPTSASRAVVRPSPDLLYSACPFDLGKIGGELRVHADAMPHTYWSVSIFDAETNNFFVLNDRHARNNSVDFILENPNLTEWIGAIRHLPPKFVRSPTVRGLILFRTLIDSDAKLAAIDAARRHAICEPYRP